MSFGVLVVPVLILLSCGLIWTGIEAYQNVPRVCIDDGCLRGSWMKSTNGQQFEVFFGIPFAKPPIGELRFADPVPNDGWADKVKELDVSGKYQREPCLQHYFIIPGSVIEGKEDCLYLNVYRPTMVANGTAAPPLKMPTVVYIHGGAYIGGYNSPLDVGPENLMDHPIILVTITYRVGALGFLSTGDEAASGNFGLKDQRLALRWVNRNIRSFGGDPRLVTIMGQSAGGVSVQLHMMHRENEGLFQRAISLSGSALTIWSSILSNPEQSARYQASLLGIEGAQTMTTQSLVEALRAVDAKQIVSSYAGFMNGSQYPLAIYGPVIEKPTVKDAFLTSNPLQLWSQGSFLNVPWLTGIVPNDGFFISVLLLKPVICSKQTLADQRKFILTILGADNNPSAFHLLKKRFFPNVPLFSECITLKNIDTLTKIFNEAFFIYPFMLSAQLHLKYEKSQSLPPRAPVHMYKFNYRGEQSYSSIFIEDTEETMSHDFGIVHCDELIYIFRAPILFPDFKRNSADAIASQRLTKFLVNFARTGMVRKQTKNNESANSLLKYGEFPPAIEFFNSNNPRKPLGLRPINIYDPEILHFWKRFYSS